MLTKQLCHPLDIFIKKNADKTNIYIALNKSDFNCKLQKNTRRSQSFFKVHKNPSNQLKSKINLLITANNAQQGCLNLPKITGECKPKSINRIVKTHKQHFPFQPIILQVTTLIYDLTKHINQLITTNTPSKSSLESSHGFIQILQTSKPNS